MKIKADPAMILDSLDDLAAELGDYLPGLGDVAKVLREQIAQALIDKARAEGREAPPTGLFASGGVIPPAPPSGPSPPPPGAPRLTQANIQINVGERVVPGSALHQERLAAARRKRGIGT